MNKVESRIQRSKNEVRLFYYLEDLFKVDILFIIVEFQVRRNKQCYIHTEPDELEEEKRFNQRKHITKHICINRDCIY